MLEHHIEEIIEIVLDNVSCEHSGAEDHGVGGIMGHVDYSLDNEQGVKEKVLKVLEKINLKGD